MEAMKPDSMADDLQPEMKELQPNVAALKELNESFAHLLSLVPDGLMMTGRQGRITYVNKAMEQIIGCASEDILGGVLDDPRWDFKCAGIADRQDDSVLQSVFQTKKPVVDEICHLTFPEGRRGVFIVNAAVHYDAQRNPAGIAAIISDRTELSDVRAEKEEIKAVYERLSQYSDEVLFRIDVPDGGITFINDAARNIFGFTLEDYRHDAAVRQRVISPAHIQAWLDKLGRDGSDKNVLRNIVISGTSRTGQTVVMEYTVIAVRDEDGRLICVECMGRDITVRRLMEAELARAQKLESIGLLAGGIAHDFNNILTAVFGSLSLAKMEAAPQGSVYTRLVCAEQQCMKARSLTRKLLTYSRGGSSRRKIVSIADVIRETADFALSGKNTQCRFSLPDGLWPAQIDESQMRQVVHSLVTNACEAMPRGGVVEIGAENLELATGQIQALKSGRYIRWYVRDEGAGMSPEYMRRAFDPYFTTKPMNSFKGMGLGLAICHSIVKSHEGIITVDSTPGKGSVFTVFVPAAGYENEERKPASPLTAQAQGRQKILLIDDEQILLDVTGSMLEHLGYDVETAKSHAAGRELYRQAEYEGSPFALIIMDLTMRGDESGETAIRCWKEAYPEVKAVISSGYMKDPVIEEYWKYGFAGAIAKPYSLEELKGLLEKILAGP
jgi:PAS domain S-box-containing protein